VRPPRRGHQPERAADFARRDACDSKSPQATPDVDEELLARLADLYSKDDWLSARLSEAMQTEKLAG